MAYSSLEEALVDLEKARMLKRISKEVSPELEMPAIAREAFERNGPAILFENVKGSPFRAVSNIFGTKERAYFLFRKTLPKIKTAIQAKANPLNILKNPKTWLSLPSIGLSTLPLKSFSAKVLSDTCTLQDLPQIKSWPRDGGAFLTLPQVCSLPFGSKNMMQANIGMYRIQISGNNYSENECGLHYQINRGIAKHHTGALQSGKPLKVSIFLGGPPAHSLAAAMPMPDNLSETIFAGLLAGRSFRYLFKDGYPISCDADFCITGEIAPELKPEGPFGDHMGYYSEKHLFPCMKVHKVYHKKNAIFPFTVVGRPPAEDSILGSLIHELVEPMVEVSVSGLHEMHAVDASGVHPLLLALGSERFIPYQKKEPLELLKIANALLGFNQASLAKYLWITDKESAPNLSTRNVPDFMLHILERIHFDRDLHFETTTSFDTLDYSSGKINHGSKVVFAATGEPCRTLGNNSESVASTLHLPDGFKDPALVAPGILAVSANANSNIRELLQALENFPAREHFPLITVTEDSSFCAKNFDNWIWVTFTRSDPASDIYGAFERTEKKHYSCSAPLVIDARLKPGYPEVLTMDAEILQQAKETLNALSI